MPAAAEPTESSRPSDRPGARRPTRWLGSAVIVAIIFLARAFLPALLAREINARLAAIPGFTGHVDRIGVQLWHGGYTMYHVVVSKREGAFDEPYFSAGEIHFSIAYREFLHGRFVSDIEVAQAHINLVRGPTAQTSQLEADRRWQDVVNDFFPIQVTHLELTDGRIHYLETASHPRIDLAVEHLHLRATGLRNRPARSGDPLPARLTAEADVPGAGKLNLFVAAEPLADRPHFQFRGSLTNVSLPAYNEFLSAYASVTVSRGTFDVYSEVSGANGSFEGYAKPIVRELDFKNAPGKKTLIADLWEDLVVAAAKLLRDKDRGQVATLIPFSGKFHRQTSVEFWTTVGNLLHNGFIQAMRKGLEGTPKAKGEIVTTPETPSPLPASAAAR